MRRIIHRDAGRLPQHAGILVVARRLGGMTDLQQQFAVGREFEHLAIAGRIAAEPHIAARITPKRMFGFRPIRHIALSAPGSEDVAIAIEFQHRWHPLGRSKVMLDAGFIQRIRQRPLQHPDMIV